MGCRNILFIFIGLASFFCNSILIADEDIQVFRGKYLISTDYVGAQALDLEGLYNQNNLKGRAITPSIQLVEFPEEVGALTSDPLQALNEEKVEADCEELKELIPYVSSCEPDVLWSLEATPNDQDFKKLWGIKQISASSAWDITQGSKDIIVAVTDTGVDYTHPDLASNMWHNPGEIPANGKDDDGNGYIDDIYGIDSHNKDSDPLDDHGHGTHCAGTIGGVGNNSLGVAGINWRVSIMALKFLGAYGGGSTSNAIELIDYAIDKGAHIINASWGGYYSSPALEKAINRAQNSGILFVAAAGNSASDNDSKPHYPSNYNLSNIISVGATDDNDKLAYFSNYGAVSVDVAAPGVSIYSTLPGGGYGSMSGTSMAAPHVSGLAALVLSNNGHQSLAELRSHVIFGRYISNLSGKIANSRRIDAYSALTSEEFTPPQKELPQIGKIRIKSFGRRKKLRKLVKGRSFVLEAKADTPGDEIASLTMTFSGTRLSEAVTCNLGSFALKNGKLKLRGRFPAEVVVRLASRAQASVQVGSVADSARRRFRRSKAEIRRLKRRKLRQRNISSEDEASACRQLLQSISSVN